MRNRKSLLLAAATFVSAFGIIESAEIRREPSTNAGATPIPSIHLHNLFRATTNVYSGNSPEGDAAFAELVRLGVKTVISVDGARPDVETARQHGLRYIHLPVGYDGVPTNRVTELVKAAQSQAGPIYVHCHHGKHRGPAAVAVICEATANWTTNRAVAWLKEAGTADEYAGLYRSAMEFRLPDAAALARIVELPEVAKPSSVVEAMVAIDAEFDRLKAAQKRGWDKIPDQPDITPAHTATILREHFRELLRSEDTAGRPADYRAKLDSSEKLSAQLRVLLHEPKAAFADRNTVFQSLGKSCVACHTKYRD
jgi:protein tyrosine/serine phosphatase